MNGFNYKERESRLLHGGRKGDVYDHFQLDWDSEDGKREIPVGLYATKEQALSDIEAARQFLTSSGWGVSSEEIDAGEFVAFYNGPDLTISNVEVTMEGGGVHEYRMINFEIADLDQNYWDYIDEDGTLCAREDSLVNLDVGLTQYQATQIRYQLIDWLESNPQPDLTDEAVPAPAA
ncbi:hypothetical protein ACTOV4_10195 [Brucella sp. C7-11G]